MDLYPKIKRWAKLRKLGEERRERVEEREPKGGNPSKGDAVVGVRKSEGEEKKRESLWKVMLAEVT